MKKEYIASGKTINDAVDDAVDALGLDRDSIEIEVLETPSKGFLGLGSTNAKVKITYDVAEETDNESICKYVKELFEKMGIDNVVATIKEQDGEMLVDVAGNDMGTVIGRRGETLDALQYLISLFVNRKRETHIRVALDIENYRQKRKETLERLAKRLAASAVKKRGSVHLEPMQPYERRIIHSVLQDFKDVTTSSQGIEPRRKVVITYSPNNK